MNTIDFTLKSRIREPIVDGPMPAGTTPLKELNLRLGGRIAAVGVGTSVVAGERVAVHPDPAVADLHAPVSGDVVEVSVEHICIQPDGGSGCVERHELSAVSDAALRLELKALGVETGGLRPARVLIVNAVNPEPRVDAPERLLAEASDVVIHGLRVARRLIRPEEIVLAVPEGVSGLPELDGCRTKRIAPTYPKGLPPLVAKAVTGKERNDDVVVLSTSELWGLGRVAATGLPLAETVLCVGDRLYRVLVGTPVGQLLACAGMTPETGDRIVLGGALRGEAVYSPALGVDARTQAVLLLRKDEVLPVSDSPCLNCGECVLHCPARILPNMIGRYSEFKLFDKAARYGLDFCFECGLCGYWCLARRPLLQYIRLAKRECAAREVSSGELSSETAAQA